MSRRRFLGWEPAQVTTHEYDDGGRLLRSVTEVEAEWDPESRGYVLALLSVERDRCPRCAQPMSEALALGRGYEPPKYKAEGVRCKSCEAIHAYAQSCSQEQLSVLRIHTVRDDRTAERG